MLDELSNSVKATLYERLSSPLAGAFLLSWGVWNWRPLLVLVASSASVEDRIEYVGTHYWDAANLYWGPLLSTIVLVTLVPWLSAWTFKFVVEARRYQLFARDRFLEASRLTLQQSQALRKELRDTTSKLHSEVEDKGAQIRDLLSHIQQLEEQLAEAANLREFAGEVVKSLTDGEKELLTLLSQNEGAKRYGLMDKQKQEAVRSLAERLIISVPVEGEFSATSEIHLSKFGILVARFSAADLDA